MGEKITEEANLTQWYGALNVFGMSFLDKSQALPGRHWLSHWGLCLGSSSSPAQTTAKGALEQVTEPLPAPRVLHNGCPMFLIRMG